MSEEYISCPFCKEDDFDLIGLKGHLLNGRCEVFNLTDKGQNRYIEEKMKCNRCDKAIKDPEYCWYCESELCKQCWEKFGHCGHPEADKANELSAKATTWEERHSILETTLKQGFN